MVSRVKRRKRRKRKPKPAVPAAVSAVIPPSDTKVRLQKLDLETRNRLGRYWALIVRALSGKPLTDPEEAELVAFETSRPGKRRQIMVSPDGEVATQRDVALVCGLTTRTIQNWERDPSFPCGTGTPRLLPRIIAWLVERERRKLSDRSQKTVDATYRLKMAQAAAMERSNQIAEDKLVDRETVTNVFNQWLIAFREGLEDISKRAPIKLAGTNDRKTCQDILEADFAKLCNGLAETPKNAV